MVTACCRLFIMNNNNTTTYSYNSNLDLACDKAVDEVIAYVRMTFIKSNNFIADDNIKSDLTQIIRRNMIGNNVNINVLNC